MKRKILAIALSLALLTSLFVFAPVSAKLHQTEFQIVKEAVDDYLANNRQSNIKASALFALLDDDDKKNDPYIVDIRSESRYITGHIPGAVWVAWGDITKLGNKKGIVLYCYSGQTASTAKSVLGVLGYDVTNLSHGMCSWTTDSTYLAGCFNSSKVENFAFETTANSPAGPYGYPELNNTNSRSPSHILMAAAQSVTSKKIKAVDLKAAIDAGGDMTIIDMRSSTHYNYGHIPGAINIRLSDLVANLSSINPNAPVYVNCYTGHTAGEAVALLNMLGYDAYSLSYGYCSWNPDHLHGCFSPPSTDLPVEPGK